VDRRAVLLAVACCAAFGAAGALAAAGCSREQCLELSERCPFCADETYRLSCFEAVARKNESLCAGLAATFDRLCVTDPETVPEAGTSGGACAAGLTLCQGSCVDTRANATFCGSCINACKGGEVCAAGSCQSSCPDELALVCAGACVDARNDPRHCGACDQACEGATPLCQSGQCVAGCDAGGPTPTACNGSCTSLAADTKNCGACGKACLAGQVCSQGSCAGSCASPLKECCGACVDVTTDALHCGDCGSCDPNTVTSRNCVAQGLKCSGGTCVARCPAGTTDCGGSCVDVTKDAKNCGACGTLCVAGEVCASGVCTTGGCQAGLTACGTSCVDLASDPKNCGECATSCNPGKVCSAGVCTTLCAPGLTACNAACVDLTNDPQNCGACATKCLAGQVCSQSACTTSCAFGETSCNGSCVSLSSSVKHCGQCGTSCVDGNICTADSCSVGTCVNATGQFSCDDGDPCTEDTCDPKTGCKSTPLTADQIIALCQQIGGKDPNKECIWCGSGQLCNSAPLTQDSDNAACTVVVCDPNAKAPPTEVPDDGQCFKMATMQCYDCAPPGNGDPVTGCNSLVPVACPP
jgi:hypothetical protein